MKVFFNNDAKQINVLDERFYQSSENPEKFYPSVTTGFSISILYSDA